MGNNISKLETLHKDCLLHITKEQGYKIQERKLIQLLIWVKTYCPWYPPNGSYDLDHWKRVGESLKSHQVDSHEVNPDEFITWLIVYSALQAFRDSEEILHPAVNLSADTSHALTTPLSRPDSVGLQVEEGINGEEQEGDLVNPRAIDLRQECDLYPAIKPQPLKAMTASPSTDTKVLKQQSCLPPYDMSPLRHVTDNELSLSPEPKSFLDTCRRQALDQGDVELLHDMPTVYQGNQPHHEQISYEMVKELRKSVKENGLQSSYTMRLVEAIAKNYVMLPADWKALFKLIMTTRQYSIWCAEYEELCENQARANMDTGNAGITKDHLAGTGAQTTIRDQLRMPPETYNQVRGLAIRALKRVPDINRTERGFSTIRQGPQEPYINFIDRLQTAGTAGTANPRSSSYVRRTPGSASLDLAVSTTTTINDTSVHLTPIGLNGPLGCHGGVWERGNLMLASLWDGVWAM
ncbi:endogenous retrovirus group K member 10 Gag polyprotein-like [Zonotrichia leucophrys gambelii]|uniref:endogenous retrovirus group K member 10 Gag polyprotein-like n=1 Tax=Zonotrichia leucophrys gambelii TaxID=257770 RepID=UPI00314014D9